MDFEGIVKHEIGHVLGFQSDVDRLDEALENGTQIAQVFPTALDLFRLRPGEGIAGFAIADRLCLPGLIDPEEPDQVTFDVESPAR